MTGLEFMCSALRKGRLITERRQEGRKMLFAFEERNANCKGTVNLWLFLSHF